METKEINKNEQYYCGKNIGFIDYFQYNIEKLSE